MKFYQTWQGALLADRNPDSVITAFPAEVPGNLQYDLAVHEGIADTLMYGTNAKRFLEVEDNFWKYETTLQYSVKDGERVYFVAEGIDYRFDIILDGKTIYSHEGMYTKTELDITGIAHSGSRLTVLIYPHPKLEGEFATPREMAAQSCKPPATYEWDWNPRLIISGIWKPCYIETRTKGYIRRCEPFYTLNADRTAASVRFETDCDIPCTYTVTDMDGNVVYTGTEASCTLENIRLWWCSGQGDAYLYRWTAKNTEHEISGRIGFRTVKLVMNGGGADHEPLAFPKSRYPAPITIELNGVEDQVYSSARANGEYDLIRHSWTADFNDPINYLDLYTSYSGGNYNGVNSPEYDALIEASNETSDQVERNDLLHQAEQILVGDNFFVIPVTTQVYICLWNPRLTNVSINEKGEPMYRYADLAA